VMAYKDKFSERIELDLDTTAVQLAVKIVMQEGELRFREKFAEVLASQVASARKALPDEKLHWEDGVNYVIHLLKEIDLRESE
jgi:hypothetical protein